MCTEYIAIESAFEQKRTEKGIKVGQGSRNGSEIGNQCTNRKAKEEKKKGNGVKE